MPNVSTPVLCPDATDVAPDAVRSDRTAAVILAAGKSTRMRSRIPKPLHPVCGLPMTAHVISVCRQVGVEKIVVVVGHEAEAVRAGLGEGVEYALQSVQRGTGDAVSSAHHQLADWEGTILVLAGDVPLLSAETLRLLLEHQRRTRAAVTLLTAILDDPTGYGRIVRDDAGCVARIVEQKDASAEVRAIREVNPSLYAFHASALWTALADVKPNNAQGEYYLTDTVANLVGAGALVEALPAPDPDEVLGVNNRIELAKVSEILRRRILDGLMLDGVSVTDPTSTYVDVDVTIGQDSVIEPNTFLLRGTRAGEGCVLGPFARIEASRLGDNVRVLASQIVGSQLEDGVRVGPFANIRPDTHLGAGVKIGDFVETKNARMEAGSQASHLSYIGDAEVGAGTNIGAGTITCNYDGHTKHRTVIGERAFVGSHSTLVAPITIGDGALIAAGSTLTEDVPANALAIARSRGTIKEGKGAQYRREQRGLADSTLGSNARDVGTKRK